MKLLDLDNHTTIRLAEDRSSFAFMGEAGTGRVVKGVNTTPDVGVNEIPRQAAKFKIQVNRDGYPPVACSNGKIPKLESADINEANKWLKAGAVAAALAGAGMGAAHAQNYQQGNNNVQLAQQSQPELVNPTFMDTGDLAAFEKARADWLKSGQLPDYIEQLNDVIKWGNNANMTPAEVKQIMPRLLNFAKLIQWHVQPKIEMSNPSWMSPTVLPVFTKLKAEWLATNPSRKDIEGLNQYINDFKKIAGNTTPAASSQAAGGVFQYMKDHAGPATGQRR
jgi:hypothetical protein